MSLFSFAKRPAIIAVALAAGASAAVVALAMPASATETSKFSFTKVEGAAGDAAGLTPTVNAFRALLGEPDNRSNPPAAAGRREINWDGTPDAQSAPNLLPPNFFNTNVPRGAEFAAAGGNRFQVSANAVNPTNTPTLFANINPQYDDIFTTFSPQRLFTPLGTNKMSVRFFVPGTQNRATVNGFGAVFTDVDKENTTKIELLDKHGNRIFSGFVPKGTKASKSLSFLGIKTSAAVYEVRITTGNAPLSAHNNDGRNGKDIVVMDDFLYSEPKRVK